MPVEPTPTPGQLTLPELLVATDTFTSQLENPLFPQLCPRCLHSFACNLWDETRERTVPVLLAQRHEFWTAAARLVSACGALDDLSTLRHVLDFNARACPDKHRHVYAFKSLPDSVYCTMDALCRSLCAALGVGPHKKYRNILLSLNGLWPSRLEDVAPATVAPYVRWAAVIPSAWPHSLVCCLLGIARRSVMHTLLQQPTRHMLVATLVRAFRQWQVPDSEFPADVRAFISPDGPIAPPTQVLAAGIIHQCSVFIVSVQEGPDRRMDDLNRLADGFELLLHNAIAEIVSKDFFTDGYENDSLLRAASALAARANFSEHRLVMEYRQDARSPLLIRDLTLADAIYCYLSLQRNSMLCLGPACERFSREGIHEGQPLSVCSRCQFMRYCSRACQRLDWKTGQHDVPHKMACAALCKLQSNGLLHASTTIDDFAAAYQNDSLMTPTEFGALMKLALNGGVLPEPMRVAIARMVATD